MNGTPFEQFIALVQVDQKINSLNASIASLEKSNKENLAQEAAAQQALELVKNKLHDMKKEVDKKNKLDRVANHKEYQLLKNEIDTIKQDQHNLEEGLMIAWNQLENARKEFDVAQKAFQEQSASIHEAIKKNQEKIESIKQDIQTIIEERVNKEKGLPEEWLEKYAIMRARVSDPVVPVLDGNCSACFYKISVQDMQSLKHRKLIQCKDCFRLLYLEGIHTTAQEKATE